MRIRTRGSNTAATVATPATPSTDIRRRRFLLTLGASGAVVAAPASAATLDTPPVQAADDRDVSYRETLHVRDYYRTTKL